MRIGALAAQLAALAVLPIVRRGRHQPRQVAVGRAQGPAAAQLAFDLLRLLRKRAVYSATTTGVFQLAPWLVLVTALTRAALIVLDRRRAGARVPASTSSRSRTPGAWAGSR